MQLKRESGILLHVTSLPSPYGIGDLGPSAYEFADFLAGAGQGLWQMLPVVPAGHGYSPYSSPSTFAGSPMLLSPDLLLKEGLLSSEDLGSVPTFPLEWVDFQKAIPFKQDLLMRAFAAFEAGRGAITRAEFDAFREKHAAWLADYALFETLKEANGGVEWTEWPKALAGRQAKAMAAARAEHARAIEMQEFWQFLFARQWSALKTYCNERGVRIFGDLPIYVAQDSADVWAEPHLFHLDKAGRAKVVAGVPPDYFSETGQRWGNPIYRWDVMRKNDYAWWRRRMARILELVDVVRLDHFRGFEAYWEVPASEPTAVKGRWVKGPGEDLFESLTRQLGELPVVAENLGVITEGVTNLMARFGYPGMAIFQFAFDTDASNEFLPHNYVPSLAAYTGTHDNDTFVGWWTDTQTTLDAEVVARAKSYCREYLQLGHHGEREIHWHAIRAVMGSVAALAVFPLQDVLGYGADARMNVPGKSSGNWGWRFAPGVLRAEHGQRLRYLARVYGRLSDGAA